jgi:hypothetical protein
LIPASLFGLCNDASCTVQNEGRFRFCSFFVYTSLKQTNSVRQCFVRGQFNVVRNKSTFNWVGLVAWKSWIRSGVSLVTGEKPPGFELTGNLIWRLLKLVAYERTVTSGGVQSAFLARYNMYIAVCSRDSRESYKIQSRTYTTRVPMAHHNASLVHFCMYNSNETLENYSCTSS